MSHYSILVIGGNVEEKLEPYEENLEVAPYIKYRKAELIAEKRNLAMQNIKYKEYSDMALKEFIETWHGLKADEDGNALSTYNPLSKWDWYQIGGRWQGMFKLKPESELKYPDMILRGKKSWMDKEEYKEGWTDQACFIDIDWEGMRLAHDIKEIEKNWDEVIAGKSYYNPEYYLERYKTKEKYVESHTRFGTYAVITEDGKWNEPGRMGWFGCSSASTEDESNWDEEFWDRFMKDLKEDTLLTIVDCHI